jgi:WD40 repeat protein/tRNA A-37 threonylcarbamoyl transferase component Bud32
VGNNSKPAAGSLKDWSPSQYLRISELLDEWLEMPDAAREVWLAALERTDPTAAAVIHNILASQAAAASGVFLESPKILAHQLKSTPQADSALIGKQFGPYRVLSLLGHGGMGSVWLAERVDGLFSRQVALKLVHPALMSQTMTERLSREREILAGLDHPGIARLFDAGFAEDGQPYLALEYVAGSPFTAYCDNHQLPIRERLQLFRQILDAVQYAHAHLVIHRDLKPSNILVTAEGQVKLLDFGIAKLLSEGEARETELTRLGGRALTPEYAAPEQIARNPITTAADVYALGVMLYELLTGERPYRPARDSRGALEEAILYTDPVLPSRIRINDSAAPARAITAKRLSKVLNRDLDAITLKALKKSATERYPTANAFDDDIGRYLQGDVVLAQRDSVAYRALRFVRRYRLGIAVASLVLLTLAVGLAATSYEARIASRQRDAAMQAQLRSLTQTAAARLKDGNAPAALDIILRVLPQQGAQGAYTPEALSVFQEANAADARVSVVARHEDRVRSVAFSPGGEHIATGSDDTTARIWDAVTGQEILRLSGHSAPVTSVGFSPDGRRLVTGSIDQSARVWDAATGREILRLSGHSDGLRSVAFSPDGLKIVTGSRDKTARIWDAQTGRELMQLLGHTEWVTSAAFSADGRRIVTGSFDATALIWDAGSGRQLLKLIGHSDRVTFAAFSPDDKRVVTASADKTARVWDAASGQQLLLLAGHTDRLTFAAFSPDGRRIITAGYDKVARLWDADSGRLLKVLIGHTDLVQGAAFSPDGKRLATASDDHTVRLWDAIPDREILVLVGHAQTVSSAAFSPDGRRIATTGTDKTIRVWDAATGQALMVTRGHVGSVASVAFSPDGTRLITGSFDKTARIWDATTGLEVTRLTGHSDTVGSAYFSPDGGRIVTASLDKTARVWDLSTSHMIALLSGHTDLVETAMFSPDGKQIVTASNDRTARIWDAATGRQLKVLRGHDDQVVSAVFSPDGRRIATSSGDRTARLWDAADGTALFIFTGHTDVVNAVAFSPDGRRLVTASVDRTARIWDTATGEQLAALSGHGDIVESAVFSPDGGRIVTSSDDGTARVWDAHVPTLSDQISWAEAAQFDVLSVEEEFQLGLSVPPDVRRWSGTRSACDEAAAAPYDPDRRAAGVMLDQIAPDMALEACAGAGGAAQVYQHGRAQGAAGHFAEARHDFEDAVAHNYRSARVDLGLLLLQPASGMVDTQRAISLYERAWHDGVARAAFELALFYELGVATQGHEKSRGSDEARAWLWYRRAADVGEPSSLARFAEKADQAAFAANSAAERRSHFLEAFEFYARAADRARAAGWPDEAWRDWRYRRASLARLLAHDGLMREVAKVYDDVRAQYAAARPVPRLVSSFFTGN